MLPDGISTKNCELQHTSDSNTLFMSNLLETFEESSINVPLYILSNKMQYSLFLFIVLSNAILCMINQKKKKKRPIALLR